MLKNRKNDLLFLLNIIEYIEKIRLYSDSFENPEILYETNDQMNYNAILSLLTQIGENSAKLSDDTKNDYSYPWKDVVGLRNRITHDYTGINIFVVFQTIKYSLPGLQEKAYQIIQEGISETIFDKTELLSARTSNYYTHIDFRKFEI